MVSLIDPGAILFGRTRQAILSLVFTHPDESFYLREIVRRTGTGIGPAQRELAQLISCGILRREKERFFRANSDSPIFEALKQLVVRTSGIADGIQSALAPVADQIAVSFLFGSFARGDHRGVSDVDLMIITKNDSLTLETISPRLHDEQNRLGREINPFILSAREFNKKWLAKNHFIRRVIEGDKVFLIGDSDELKRLAEKRLAKAASNQPTGNRRPARTWLQTSHPALIKPPK
jgi:predicted nucleotidyltransferase